MKDKFTKKLKLIYEQLLLEANRCKYCGEPERPHDIYGHRWTRVCIMRPKINGVPQNCEYEDKEAQVTINTHVLQNGQNIITIINNDLRGYTRINDVKDIQPKTYAFRGESTVMIWSPRSRCPYIISKDDDGLIDHIIEELSHVTPPEGFSVREKTLFTIRKNVTKIEPYIMATLIDNKENWPSTENIFGKIVPVDTRIKMGKDKLKAKVNGIPEFNPERVMEPNEYIDYTYRGKHGMERNRYGNYMRIVVPND